MYKHEFILSAVIVTAVTLVGCSDTSQFTSPDSNQNGENGIPTLSKGAVVANGWYEEEEIYYILGGVEEGVIERGENQIYFIGGDRAFQANVVLFIPGEPGYSPHWNVNVVHAAMGKTVQDIVNSGFAANISHLNVGGGENVLFDDAEDILGAEAAGLVTIEKPGVVVLCPIVPEAVADARGNTELPEDEFPAFPATF
jgi:hypothetical protein